MISPRKPRETASKLTRGELTCGNLEAHASQDAEQALESRKIMLYVWRPRNFAVGDNGSSNTYSNASVVFCMILNLFE